MEILEMIYTLSEIKTHYIGLTEIKHIRTKDNWTSGHRTIENPNGRRQRKKTENNVQHLNLGDTIKQFNVCVVEVP